MTGQQMLIERINRGYSRRRLASELNVPEQSLRRLEGGNGISLAYAKKIADWYGVTVVDLLPASSTEVSA